MIVTDFTDFFSENGKRFRELVTNLTANGYVTDEDFGVSRCLFESVAQRHFEKVFRLHFPGQSTELRVASTAFQRFHGEFVYVVYDESIYEGRAQIESRLRIDGVFDVDPEDYATFSSGT
jgi:hypothetical protein